jgi:hypothetical protein
VCAHAEISRLGGDCTLLYVFICKLETFFPLSLWCTQPGELSVQGEESRVVRCSEWVGVLRVEVSRRND